jgi:hypothetical protein
MLVFLTTFGEIFLEYSWNIFEKIFQIFFIKLNFFSYYFIKVHVKNLAKTVLFKKIKIHLQVLLLLKNNRYNV